MLYGYLPLPASINVFGVKVIGADTAANVSVGPTTVWGLDSLSKTSQITELNGDFGYGPMGYSLILDNDLLDTPMSNWGP